VWQGSQKLPVLPLFQIWTGDKRLVHFLVGLPCRLLRSPVFQYDNEYVAVCCSVLQFVALQSYTMSSASGHDSAGHGPNLNKATHTHNTHTLKIVENALSSSGLYRTKSVGALSHTLGGARKRIVVHQNCRDSSYILGVTAFWGCVKTLRPTQRWSKGGW